MDDARARVPGSVAGQHGRQGTDRAWQRGASPGFVSGLRQHDHVFQNEPGAGRRTSRSAHAGLTGERRSFRVATKIVGLPRRLSGGSGPVIARSTVLLAFIRFYRAQGTLLKITNCRFPNPISTPCFYGAIAASDRVAVSSGCSPRSPEALITNLGPRRTPPHCCILQDPLVMRAMKAAWLNRSHPR